MVNGNVKFMISLLYLQKNNFINPYNRALCRIKYSKSNLCPLGFIFEGEPYNLRTEAFTTFWFITSLDRTFILNGEI